MKLVLSEISADNKTQLNSRIILLYGDFNVLNIIYEKKLKFSEEITIYPESTCVYLILKYFYNYKVKKIVSTDYQYSLLKCALKLNKKIFFFGDKEEILEKIRMKLYDLNKINCFSGAKTGYNYDNEDTIKCINSSAADILFVGLGAGRQEEWIMNNFSRINAKVIIATGGWFNYLSGSKKRAPDCIRKKNLEWLHKLVTELKRVWKRYIFGVPLFVLRILLKKIILELK